MAPSISLLLIKRISLFHINPKSRRLFQPFLVKSLSTSAQSNPSPSPEQTHKPSSLSSRLSFVFDPIDAIEKRHSEKDETLERIRAWRQSKQPPSAPDPVPVEGESISESVGSNEKPDLCVPESTQLNSGDLSKENGVVELVHPWPEWMELMERRQRDEEDEMVHSLGIDVSSSSNEENPGVSLFQDFRAVQNACVNFGKDRFDIPRQSGQKLRMQLGKSSRKRLDQQRT